MLPITTKLSLLIPDAVLHELDGILSGRNITSVQLACFLAQCAHESGGFKITSENLNYSANGLLKTFGKYFNPSTAALYAHKPIAVANKVYANRNGNGNEQSGEGWKYRGRGHIQITGKSNYEAFDKTVPDDIILHPDLVADKYPLASAFFYFDQNDLWDLAGNIQDFTILTERINGGRNGLDDRLNWLQKIKDALK